MNTKDTTFYGHEYDLLKVGEWCRAPAPALTCAKLLAEEYGGNIAIGRNETLGWYVLHDQGYGVGLVWSEKKERENTHVELSRCQDKISKQELEKR